MEVAERTVNIGEQPTTAKPWYVNYTGRIPAPDAPDRAAWVTIMLDVLGNTPGENYGATDMLSITEDEVLDYCVAIFKPRGRRD
ncbi:MAG: hypothetical protein LBN97_09695 [Oscillospiraceae bacterium]|jgi:hypothetical protein|nr:hypothetical protein [Oscillospiraceae bacterium]